MKTTRGMRLSLAERAHHCRFLSGSIKDGGRSFSNTRIDMAEVFFHVVC